MCSVRGQSHRLSLSVHYLRRLQGNASKSVIIVAIQCFYFRLFWACAHVLCRVSSGGQYRRISTQPTLVSMRGNASSIKLPETSARNVASRSALQWGWQPTVSVQTTMTLCLVTSFMLCLLNLYCVCLIYIVSAFFYVVTTSFTLCLHQLCCVSLIYVVAASFMLCLLHRCVCQPYFCRVCFIYVVSTLFVLLCLLHQYYCFSCFNTVVSATLISFVSDCFACAFLECV